ncbi:Pentatricopeptide repeat-containing protein 2, mitochondrial [Colletotrichum tanaceti]|uniref:Pentatricopeptide repeat-containing protein 2, mitochondrial n=1 Tax=Colletotrichum tanaceti TaxID=1306861 RepID=A0A4U6XUK2_9PEZI|nr:Pentatricopeptide repeat-containing protein 2, mitochondrial [Colletotrichum tanaceti]TKW59675.1 Pentatricopeptide repeat-containing protein 2, mitochondrial [Colletotrichum tanaceti]
MLSCKACLRRAIQPLSTKASFFETSATASTLQHGLPAHLQLQQRPQTTVSRAAFMGEARISSRDPDNADDVAEKNRKRKMEWAVDQHLKHMDDPFNIAQHVEATLKKGRFDEALLLVQRSSKDKQVAVAWNHLIEYKVRDKSVNAAIKLFNDMKKRGQLPNDRTYTILLTGCAKSLDPKAAVPKAVAIYNSLLKESSAVRANSFHLNAVLQVCGRAGDVDAMFSIADTADARAGRKTTAYTYTTIINALRFEVENPEKQKSRSLQETLDAMTQMVKRCKAIWEEVMRNWRKGTLEIDEDLVCAMARVLLLGDKKDQANIMPLLEETMSVRDLACKNPAKDHALRMNEGMKGIAAAVGTAGSAQQKAVPSTKPRINYAIPRSNTLSLVLNTLLQNRQAKLAVQYWNHFVYYYGLEPDSDNWNQLLRIYERNGSSRDAAKLVQKLPDEMLVPIMYRRALSACVNDKMNQKAFENATAVLERMTAHVAASKGITSLDVRALHIYLKVGLSSNFHFRQVAKSGKVEEARRAYGEQLAAAVNNTWAPFTSAKDAMLKTKPKMGGKTSSKTSQTHGFAAKGLIEIARNMISAVDRVVNENRLADEEAVEALKQKRNKLNRFVVEFTDPNQQKDEDLATKDTPLKDGEGVI